MTAQAAAACAERVRTDEDFARTIAKAGTPQQRLAVARDAGYDLTADDLPSIKEALGLGELSDEDLEKIAGGTRPPDEDLPQ